MNSTKPSSTPQKSNPQSVSSATAGARSNPGMRGSKPPVDLARIRTTGREYVNPVDYEHPYDSMNKFADFLALRYDANRTRHAYYRQVRLIHEHFKRDPAEVTEEQLRDYFCGRSGSGLHF